MKKVVAPVIIVLLILGQISGAILLALFLPIPLVYRILISIAVLAVAGALVAVLIERIKEIFEEDEDDYSKY